GPLRAGALGSRGLLAVGPIGLEGDRDRLPRLERRGQATGGLGDLLAGLVQHQLTQQIQISRGLRGTIGPDGRGRGHLTGPGGVAVYLRRRSDLPALVRRAAARRLHSGHCSRTATRRASSTPLAAAPVAARAVPGRSTPFPRIAASGAAGGRGSSTTLVGCA